MPLERILPQQYMHLSRELREQITTQFNIKRTGISEVRDQDVLSDGTTYDDLLAISAEKMCEYIGSEETFARAWELTVAKAYSELHPPVGEIKATVKEVVVEDAPPMDDLTEADIAESTHAKKETSE